MTNSSFEHILIRENGDPLVLLRDEFILGRMYFHMGLSPTKDMYLRKTVVEKLLKIQKKLKKYRIKIWDGYRPREVQRNIYIKFQKELQQKYPGWDDAKLAQAVETYVANPDTSQYIPPHATGGTIDVTLTDEDGKELPMGTGFDFFGPEAAPFYYEENDINDDVKNNRKLLRDVMFDEDFTIDSDEWWHFNYGNQFWAAEKKKPFAIFDEAHI